MSPNHHDAPPQNQPPSNDELLRQAYGAGGEQGYQEELARQEDQIWQERVADVYARHGDAAAQRLIAERQAPHKDMSRDKYQATSPGAPTAEKSDNPSFSRASQSTEYSSPNPPEPPKPQTAAGRPNRPTGETTVEEMSRAFSSGGEAAVQALIAARRRARARTEPTPPPSTTPQKPKAERHTAPPRQEAASDGRTTTRKTRPERGESRDILAETVERAKFWAEQMPREMMVYLGKLGGKDGSGYNLHSIAQLEGGTFDEEIYRKIPFYSGGPPPWLGRSYPESVYSPEQDKGYDWTVIEQPSEKWSNDNREYFSVSYMFAAGPLSGVDSRPSQPRFTTSVPRELYKEFVRDVAKYPDLMNVVWHTEVLSKVPAIRSTHSRRTKEKVGTFIVDPAVCNPDNLYITRQSTFFDVNADRDLEWVNVASEMDNKTRSMIPSMEKVVAELTDPVNPTARRYLLEDTNSSYINLSAKPISGNRTAVSVKENGRSRRQATIIAPKAYRLQVKK